MRKLFFMTIVWILTSGFTIIGYEGSCKGKVIDADTGDPIEGVVVLAVWNKIYPNAAGHTTKFYDAREAVTDKNGEFEIPGIGLKILSLLDDPSVTIFKAGYMYDSLFWEPGYLPYQPFEWKMKWEGEKAIIPLKKLTMEERRKQNTPDFYIGERYDEKENITHSCLPKNIKLLPGEVNKELLEQGRKPYDLEGGLCEK